jgi:Multiubiquitin
LPNSDQAGGGPKPKEIQIEVNSKEVVVADREMNGAEIKGAAIAQGVAIQANFVLQLELPNGTSKVIGDSDPVHVHNHMSFTAIAPDDNS